MTAKKPELTPADISVLPSVIVATEYIIDEFKRTGAYPTSAQAAAFVLGVEFDSGSIRQMRDGDRIAIFLGLVAANELLNGMDDIALQKLYDLQNSLAIQP